MWVPFSIIHDEMCVYNVWGMCIYRVWRSKQSVCVCYWKDEKKKIVCREDTKRELRSMEKMFYSSLFIIDPIDWLMPLLPSSIIHLVLFFCYLFIFRRLFETEAIMEFRPFFVLCVAKHFQVQTDLCVSNGSEMWLSSISETYKFVYQTQSHHLLLKVKYWKRGISY